MGIKHALQGRPFGHPLHVMIVHVPIGMFFISFVFDLLNLPNQGGRASATLWSAAWYTMAVGIAGALLAAVPGIADYSSIRRDSKAKRIAQQHMWLNIGAVVLYVVNLWMRSGTSGGTAGSGTLMVPFAMSLAGVLALSYSGYLGGVLVYDEGVGVGRHRRKLAEPDETRVASSPLDADGYFAAGRAEDLAEGGTLRVDMGGTVACVAKVDGKLHAFQEFCTHRYGPLSAGCVKDGKVMCPWHKSQFDVATGRVAEGPAKEDLKTYDVTVREGQILVRNREVEVSSAPARPTESRPGAAVGEGERDWKSAEEEAARRRVEPRVDADGKTIE